MPENIEIVDIVSSDEEEEDSDEVEIIPYTKPPPPLIDLLLSSDDEDEVSSDKKIKKNLTEKIPHSSNGPEPSAVNAGQNERMLIHAVNTTRAVTDADRESDASLNAESTVLNNNQSSSNVGASCSLSKNDDSVHQTHFLNTEKASLPSIRRSSSSFEPNNEVLGEPLSFSSARNGAANVVEPLCGGTSSCSVTGISNTSISRSARGSRTLPVFGGEQVKKVAHTKRKRITTTNPPPKYPKRLKRTSEEIANFLTLLGIFKPNNTISPTKSPERSCQLDVLTIPPLLLDSQALLSEPDSDPVIIPITEISRTPVVPVSRAKAKAVRKARVPAAAPDSVQAKQNTVVAVSDTPISTAPQGGVLPDILLRPSTRVVSKRVDTGILTRAERASLSFSITPFLGPPSTPITITSNPINSKETKDPNPRTTIATSAVQSDLQKPSRTPEINVHLQYRSFTEQQIPFENYGDAFFNDYRIYPSEFHPSFNYQYYQQQQGPPMWTPQKQNHNSFRFNLDFYNSRPDEGNPRHKSWKL